MKANPLYEGELMKRIMIAIALVLSFASSASAQRYSAPVDHTTDELVAARAKLIQRYAGKSAWGVAICGGEDVLTGEQHSWLTVYVYKDSLYAFAGDFDKFATTATHAGNLGVDGISVMVVVIERPKKEVPDEHKQPDAPADGKHRSGGKAFPAVRSGV